MEILLGLTTPIVIAGMIFKGRMDKFFGSEKLFYAGLIALVALNLIFGSDVGDIDSFGFKR